MKKLGRFLKEWHWLAIVIAIVISVITTIINIERAGVIGLQSIEEGSATLMIMGQAHDVTYKVFDDNFGRHYYVYFEDIPYEISIFDDDRNGKMDSFIDHVIVSDKDDGIDIHVGLSIIEGRPYGNVYVGDVFKIKLTPESAEQLLKEAESIIRQLERGVVSPEPLS